jgi:integrase
VCEKGDRLVARKLGQIIPRGDNRWLVRVSLGRDHATGRRRYLNRTVSGSHRKAQQFLSAQLVERAESRELVGAEVTLNQYLDRWLSLAAKPRLRPKSYADYAALLARYIRPALGCFKLNQLTPLDIQSAYHQMLERKLSSRTVRYTHAVLHCALQQAVDWRQLARNPANGVALPKVHRAAPRVLTFEQARLFLSDAAKSRYGPVFVLALTTGLRPSELLALRWRDVDWQTRTITVERTLEKGSGWRFGPTKRPASRRQVQLQGWVARMLSDLHSARKFDPSGTSPENEQIFHTLAGDPLNSDYLGRELRRLLVRAGLPALRLYDLRHTAASLALAAGAPVKAISEQLGHSNTAFTLDVYAHLLPHMQAEAVQRVEALLAIAPLAVAAGHRKPPVSIRPPAVAAVTAWLNGLQ